MGEAQQEEAFWRVVALVVVLVLLALAAATKGCSDGDRATAVLRAEGYTDVRTDGWAPFACGDDSQCTRFVARAPGGAQVAGVVGCGWFFKACTVRLSGAR